MKRYLLFNGEMYYPAGGWEDFSGDFDLLDEAIHAAMEVPEDWESIWWHIVDSETWQIVKDHLSKD